MGLFIASLAFECVGQECIEPVRLGILTASFLSAATGYLVSRFATSGTLAGGGNAAPSDTDSCSPAQICQGGRSEKCSRRASTNNRTRAERWRRWG